MQTLQDAHRPRQGRRRAGADARGRGRRAGHRAAVVAAADQAVGPAAARPNIFKPDPRPRAAPRRRGAGVGDRAAGGRHRRGDRRLRPQPHRRRRRRADEADVPADRVPRRVVGQARGRRGVRRHRVPRAAVVRRPAARAHPVRRVLRPALRRRRARGRDGRLRPHAAERVGRRVQPGEHLARGRRPGAVPRRRDDRRVPLLLQGRRRSGSRSCASAAAAGSGCGPRPRGWSCWSSGSRRARRCRSTSGVASGSVSIAVGVYLRLEADKGLLTAYFRIRGEVDVLGLISASITLELSLTYHFEHRQAHRPRLAGGRGRGAVLLRVRGDLGRAQAGRLQGRPDDVPGHAARRRRHERRLGRVLRRVRARCRPEAGGPMPTTVLATALPHSLADDAPFQLTVFLTHKLVDGGPLLSDFPAAADWVDDAGRLHASRWRPRSRAPSCRCASSRPPTPRRGPPCCPRARAVDGVPDARAVGRDLAHQPGEPDERPRRRPAPRGDHGGADPTARPGRRPRGRRAAADAREPRPGRPAAPAARRRGGPGPARPAGARRSG